jgi:hypothetical protein
METSRVLLCDTSSVFPAEFSKINNSHFVYLQITRRFDQLHGYRLGERKEDRSLTTDLEGAKSFLNAASKRLVEGYPE